MLENLNIIIYNSYFQKEKSRFHRLIEQSFNSSFPVMNIGLEAKNIYIDLVSILYTHNLCTLDMYRDDQVINTISRVDMEGFSSYWVVNFHFCLR